MKRVHGYKNIPSDEICLKPTYLLLRRLVAHQRDGTSPLGYNKIILNCIIYNFEDHCCVFRLIFEIARL